MPLLFALAGFALLALFVSNVVAARSKEHRAAREELDAPLRAEWGFQSGLHQALLLAGSAACFLLSESLTSTTLGRALCGFAALLVLARLVAHFRHGGGTRHPAAAALRVFAWIYLIGIFSEGALGAWQPPAAQEKAPTKKLSKEWQEWLDAFWARHAPDGHVHVPGDGDLPHAHEAVGVHEHGDGHAHDHAGEPPPHEVPIVEYVPPPSVGRQGGTLVRLSRPKEPNAGFAEFKLANDAGALDVWLLKDARLIETLDLPAATTARLRFVEREGEPTLDLAASEATRALGSGNYFVFRPKSRSAGAWLGPDALPALVRLELATEGKVYVSDDFDLYPRGHSSGR